MKPRYLRISVTARCNLRCVYCRPKRACPDLEEPTVEEIGLLAECAAAEGVTKIRVTGGEPLLRGDLVDIIRRLRSVEGVAELTLTTNGIGLDRLAAPLRQAGLDRANVSLDTLRPERFREMTGFDRLSEVLAGIDAAVATFERGKLNTVLLRSVNDDEIEGLVRFAAERGLVIRFIENYPCGGEVSPPGEPVPAEEVRARLEDAFGGLRPLPMGLLSVARYFELPGLDAQVGVIASASHPPCATCAKLRFTAKGDLRACLFSASGVDLTPLLRQRDADAIRRAIRETFASKRRSGPGPGAAVSAPVNVVGG